VDTVKSTVYTSWELESQVCIRIPKSAKFDAKAVVFMYRRDLKELLIMEDSKPTPKMVPLEQYKVNYCADCNDKEWCRTDKLHRLECILSCLVLLLNDKK